MNTAKKVTEALMNALAAVRANDPEGAVENLENILDGTGRVETFADAGILTTDNGLVIDIGGGDKVFLTVTVGRR